MPAGVVVHLLTNAGGDLSQCLIACGSRLAQSATWDRRLVTCPACLGSCARKPNNPTTQQPDNPGLSEKDWLMQVRAYARQHGYLTYHPLHSRGSEAGWVDLVCARPGSPLVLAELKTTTGRLTPAQRQWLDVLRRATGVETYLWRPDEWDRIRLVLGEQGSR